MDSITLFSRAKINLSLEVRGLRWDSFHNIDSVVQVLELSDEITAERLPDGVIEVVVDVPDVPSGPDNFVYRASESFFRHTGIAGGVRFLINKHIPAQAGLGGGSGNAAAAIVALDGLYRTGLPRRELMDIAAEVGSDAPLFIVGGTLRMTGRGEVIDPLPDAPEMHIVIVKPEQGVSTSWAYAQLDKIKNRPALGASDDCENAIRGGNRDMLISSLRNDFEMVVCRAVPDIEKANKELRAAGAEAALLAGSGSAVFGIFASETEACRAKQRMDETWERVYITRTLGRIEQ